LKRLWSFPKVLVAGMLNHPRLMIELAVVVLVALIWVAGPLVGLESVESRVQIIVAVVVLRFLGYFIAHFLANRRAAQLEASLDRQAQEHAVAARPDHREELVAVRGQFEKAVAALKESKLGKGIKGKAALYALPWYMFIGPPASGKSTALRHSGLQFPYLGGSGQGLQGVGGTRNCDWWFTNDAVLLDTAGRYVTQEEDQDEWLGFLDLLKKYRKGKPINGVLAAISIADLLQASDEELESHAKKMRNRIDELIKRLGIVFPVYLLFTKCDLVQGFVEFFEDLNRAERERIWGCTFSRSGWANEAAPVRFKAEFAHLLSALQGRRLARLTNVRGPHKISILSFPFQLSSGQDKLTRFVEVLFQKNPYQENPLFRGFYFTSGTQEGTPIDRILGAVARASGLSDVAVSSFKSEEVKSYFLKDLFTEVIFPDQTLAGPSSLAYRQRGYLRVGVFVVAVLTVVFSVTALAVSFVGNKRLIDGTLSAALTSTSIDGTEEASIEKTVEFMDRLGRRFDDLRRYEQEALPIRLRGLYRGDQLFEPIQDLYTKRFYMTFLGPLKRAMEEDLVQFVSDGDGTVEQGSDYYYGLLKAYLMLGDAGHLNAQYVQRWLSELSKKQLQSLYGSRAVPDWVEEDVRHQMALYSYYLAPQEAQRLVLNRRLVHEAQLKLRQVPTTERIYAMVRREAGETLKPFTLDAASGGAQPSLVSDYAIPGYYTLDGWRGPFQTALTKTLEDLGQEGWVIGEPETKRTDLEQAVKKRYFQDYTRYWRSFVKSLRIRPSVSPINTEEVLAGLSQPESPLLRTFQAIDRNTVPDDALSALHGAATGILEKVKKGLGLEAGQASPVDAVLKEGTTSDFSRFVSPRFKSIHFLVSAPKDAKEAPPLERYIVELRKVHQALRPILRSEGAGPDTKALAKSIVSGEPNDILQAFKTTDALLQTLDTDMQEALLPLLVEPWVMAMRGVMDRTKGDMARRWEAEVYQSCQRNIEPRYPFRVSGDDVPMVDVVDFFHPQNGSLWRFYQSELKPFIEEGTDPWVAKTWNGVGITLSPEFLAALQHARLVSESLFPKGASDLGIAFEVYPYPPQGAASRMVSEVRLDVAGQVLRYRMEPQEWHEMKWPGTSAASGAVLQVQVGNVWVMKEFKDWWGLFRLIDAGRRDPASSDVQFRIHWDLETADARALQIQYDLRARSYKNPFHPGLFETFRCMQQL
jgi:type VI secretion system protein ImpL